MNDKEADRLERKVPGIVIMDSSAKGVKYLFDGVKDRFDIAGQRGMVMLSIKQAKAVRDELSEIIELRECISERSR